MELLSPAGNPELALAAFDGGADAVYCGLGKFNARERAENFTPESLGKLIRFAGEHRKKVYVTFNTLIFENELPAMFEHLCMLAKLHPDALIVQDPGVAAVVRKYFPELTLHASTQMGIHNSAGLQCAARIGCKRVILERQITLEELQLMAKNTPVELEVFLHGSLCCSLSGRCLLSSRLCNASGNRGQCRQLCRKLYTPESGKPGFYLSPADLAGADIIEKLRTCNVSSLKIEGRLRTPDYVWKTALAYRILLDNPGDAAAFAEAGALLRAAVGRNPGTAFYHRSNWKTLIDPGQSGEFGEAAATVEKVLRNGMLVKVKTSLHLGDRLRINRGDNESFSLTAMEKERGKKVLKVRSGEKVFLPGKFHAASGDILRRIGENGFDFSRRAAALPEFQQPVNINISASPAGFTGTIDNIDGRWHCPGNFAPADKHPLNTDQLRQAFAGGITTGFTTANINVSVTGNFFVPAAILKQMRREFREYFAPRLRNCEPHPDIPVKMVDFAIEQMSAHPDAKWTEPPQNGFEIPAFIPETHLEEYRRKITAAYTNGERIFFVTHWHGFELLRDLPDCRIFTRFPFPVTNSPAAHLAGELGAAAAGIAPETPAETTEQLINGSPIPLFKEKIPVPMLVTRLPLPPGKWLDRDGHEFSVTSRQGISYMFLEEC